MENKYRADPKRRGVVTLEKRRETAALRANNQRKAKRGDEFNKHRTVENEITNKVSPNKNIRARQLAHWKEMRKASNKEEKRKPFVVGVVHHSVGSPFKTKIISAASKKGIPLRQPEGRVTRARSKALPLASATVTTLVTKKEKPLAPKGYRFKVPCGVKVLPLKQEGRKQIGLASQEGKPSFIVKSAHQEKKHKKSLQPNDIFRAFEQEQKPADDGSLKSSGLTNTVNVSTYRENLNKEIAKLEDLCKKWTRIMEESDNLPENVTDLINLTVGQTKLLIREKIAQYKGLIDECEANCGPVTVTESDLQGFWAVVNIQVDNLHSKFETLEALKENNWQEPKKIQDLPFNKKTALKVKKNTKTDTKSSPKSTKYSAGLREHIAARRRMQKVVVPNEMKSPEITLLQKNIKTVKNNTPGSASKLKNNLVKPEETKTLEVRLIRTPVSAVNNTHSKLMSARVSSIQRDSVSDQLSVERREGFRRHSNVMLKIRNQAKEISTPKNTKQFSARQVRSEANSIKKLRSSKANVKSATSEENMITESDDKENEEISYKNLKADKLFSSTVVLEDCAKMLVTPMNSCGTADMINNAFKDKKENEPRKRNLVTEFENKMEEDDVTRGKFGFEISPGNKQNGESNFQDDEDFQHVTPSKRTYSRLDQQLALREEIDDPFDHLIADKAKTPVKCQFRATRNEADGDQNVRRSTRSKK